MTREQKIVYRCGKKMESSECQDVFEVELITKQYAMVSECIERVSAHEREFDTDSEGTLKEVAEKFKAEYKELNKNGR